MLTKNLTPFLVGTKLTSLRPPTPAMSIVVRATFALRPGQPLALVEDPLDQRPLSSGTYAPDDDERIGDTSTPDDFVDFKPRADVMLKGHCHTPRGAPLAECPVVFKVGSWSKSARVTGPRVWTEAALGAKFTDPQPFTKMALSWRTAFGGPGFARNPVGKGYKTSELPNVSNPRDVFVSSAAELEPAAFGPINPAWPERASKIGTRYGAEWKKTRAPFFAADFDWSHFNEAPADQRLDGYLKGDESLFFQNLHPEHPLLEARLPGVLARAFLRFTEARDGKRFVEVPLVLDTLFADLDALAISLSFRGVVDVGDEDFDDVRTLLVATETRGQPTKSLAEYEAIADAFEKDPAGLRARAPAGFYDPKPEPEPDPADLRAYLDHKLGAIAKEERDKAVPLFERALADAEAAVAEARAKGAADAKLDPKQAIRDTLAKEEPPIPRVPKPGTLPNVGVRRKVRLLVGQAVAATEKARAAGAKEEDIARLVALEKVGEDPRWREVDPHYTPPEPLSTDEPGPAADLRDRDLSDLDLAGKDLRGANLEGALLSRTNLRGANLEGARLLNAVLFKADLDGANLRAAELVRVNAAKVRARGACFEGANVDQAFFDAADLGEATFAGARGDFVVFTGANLERATLRGLRTEQGDFTAANLRGADLSAASIRRTHFTDCDASGARFQGADLGRSSFTDANLARADFTRARMERSIALRAGADGALFVEATLRGALLSRIAAERADFRRADLAGARLDKARLDKASFAEANLFEADLSRSRLSDVSFEGANLYGAKLLRAAGSRAKFVGANLKRVVMEEG